MPNPVVGVLAGSTAISAWSANKAADAQQEAAEQGVEAEERAADRNIAFQEEQTEIMREDLAPWREAGSFALDEIVKGIETGGFQVQDFDITTTPGYEFRLSEGIKALDRSAAARGRLNSGAQKKAITRFAQNVASDEYGKEFGRRANERDVKFNILNTLSSGGQTSAARQAGSTAQLASNVGNVISNTGRAANVGANRVGTARAGGYQDIAQVSNQGVQNWLTYNAARPNPSPSPNNNVFPWHRV